MREHEVKKTINNLSIEFLEEKGIPVERDYLIRLEKVIGSSLPEEYGTFILATRGVCMPTTKSLMFSYAPDGRSLVSVFFGDGGDDESYDLIHMLESFRGRVPASLLPIGEDSGGNLICLGIAGENMNKVFFWDQDNEGSEAGSHEETEYMGNVHLIATSFGEFLGGLIEA